MPSLTASAQRRIVRFIVRNSGACRRYERIPNAPTSPQHRDVPCPFSEIGSVTTTRPRPHRPFLSRRHRPVQRRGRHRHAVPAEPHAPAGRRDPSPLPGPGHQNRRALAAVRQARLHVHGDDRTASGTRVARGRRFRRVNRRRSSARGATGRRDPGRGREAHRVQGARGLPQEERAGQGARDGPESRRLGRRGRSRGVHRHRQNVARGRRRVRTSRASSGVRAQEGDRAVPGVRRRVRADQGENRDEEPNPKRNPNRLGRLERKRLGRVRPRVLSLRRRLRVRTRRSSRRPTRVRPDRSRRLAVKRGDRVGSTSVRRRATQPAASCAGCGPASGATRGGATPNSTSRPARASWGTVWSRCAIGFGPRRRRRRR